MLSARSLFVMDISPPYTHEYKVTNYSYDIIIPYCFFKINMEVLLFIRCWQQNHIEMLHLLVYHAFGNFARPERKLVKEFQKL